MTADSVGVIIPRSTPPRTRERHHKRGNGINYNMPFLLLRIVFSLSSITAAAGNNAIHNQQATDCQKAGDNACHKDIPRWKFRRKCRKLPSEGWAVLRCRECRMRRSQRRYTPLYPLLAISGPTIPLLLLYATPEPEIAPKNALAVMPAAHKPPGFLPRNRLASRISRGVHP